LPSDEPLWIAPEAAVALNLAITADAAEPHGLLKPGELESACNRPRNMWSYGEEDVAVLAASLLSGIIRNHPFRQGNKRTGLIAARGFLIANGWDLGIADAALGPLVVDIASGVVTEEDAAGRLAESLAPL